MEDAQAESGSLVIADVGFLSHPNQITAALNRGGKARQLDGLAGDHIELVQPPRLHSEAFRAAAGEGSPPGEGSPAASFDPSP